jgi:hypothetical protein
VRFSDRTHEPLPRVPQGKPMPGQRDREDEFREIAERHGLVYSLEDPYGLSALPLSALTSLAHQEGSCWNLVYGTWEGLDFVAFDFHYPALGMDEDPPIRTREASCILTMIPAVCPPLMIRPETFGHWLLHRRQKKTLATEPKKLARHVRVTSADPRFAEAFFDEQMLAWFLEHGRNVWVEIADSLLLYVRALQPPSELMWMLRTFRDLRERIPEAVYRRFGILDTMSSQPRLPWQDV